MTEAAGAPRFDYRRRILAYADRISLVPGGRVRIMASVEEHRRYHFELVRLICGETNPLGPGFKEQPIRTAAEGDYPARVQVAHAGSYALVPAAPVLDRLASLSLVAWIMPTLPGEGRQVIMGRGAGPDGPHFALLIDERGALGFVVANGTEVKTLSTATPLHPWRWVLAVATYDASTGRTTLSQRPRERFASADTTSRVEGVLPATVGFTSDGPLCFGAEQVGETAGKLLMQSHFNGRLESPRLASKVLTEVEIERLAGPEIPDATWLVAAWDFAEDMSGDTFRDLSVNRLDGVTVNGPARAVTGRRWDGSVHDWTRMPSQYAALHFHSDDLLDCGWECDLELELPRDLKSGIYCGKLTAGTDEFYVPLFVRAAPGSRRHRIAFLASTATYLTYANNHWQIDEEKAEVKRGRMIAFTADELFLNERRDLGLSTYDTHADGSGVMYSSRLRPIVINLNPKSILWSFNLDTLVVDWLEALAFDHDVVTDEDLHAEGLEALVGYEVLVTGAHPEYWSTPMWDTLDAWLHRGGRLMYLGGNGFYWRTAFHPTRPGIVEVRRAESGARFWAADAGEYHLQFTGELGGLWRRIGRSPQSLVGVGTFATGFDRCGWYERGPDAEHPGARFILQGVESAHIGDFGLLGGGAAGIELDGVDVRLGSPPDTLVVASSTGHSAYYLQAPEEIVFNHAAVSGDFHPRVRADMAFLCFPGGGGVFATGSISWAGSLAHQGYANDVSRITENVLRRFLDPAAFDEASP